MNEKNYENFWKILNYYLKSRKNKISGKIS